MDEATLQRAYAAYERRFAKLHGSDVPPGRLVQVERHLVQRLAPAEFPERLRRFLALRHQVERVFAEGTTLSDELMLEFEEAGAWIALRVPSLLDMFGKGLRIPDPMGEEPDPSRASG